MLMDPNIVKICFIANRANWFHKIRQRMSDAQLERLRSHPEISEKVRSISRTLRMTTEITRQINKLLGEVHAIVQKNRSELKLCLINKKCFSFPDDNLLYRLLALFTADISMLDTCLQFFDCLEHQFIKHVLIENDGQQRIEKRGNASDPLWKRNLRSLRDDIFHNYSPWIRLKIEESNILPVLDLGSSLHGNKTNKKYKETILQIRGINQYIREFDNYLNRETDLLIKRIPQSE
jgi:hypothetical protein